ncbi:transposase [Chryseobacterium tongliaoense]|uniref:transposase n=1 Tax=Chryseobacterium tongliaoense TaxID=3240933 RepID=UPI00351590C8
MKINFKDIHIGNLIYTRVKENGTDMKKICGFMKCSEDDVKKIYESNTMETHILLRWCKLLEYDFFRFFSQHLILYAPPGNTNYNKESTSVLPQFRKNLYTIEVIRFILESIESGEKTKLQVITEYKIPKSTLHRWITKYKDEI